VWLATREKVPTFRSKYRRYRGVHRLIKKWYYSKFRVPKHESTGDRGAWRGLQRGRTVDRQMSNWANGKRVSKPHTYTKKLISIAFRKWGWLPVCGQLVVSDDSAGVATAVDLVMVDADGCLILVELKCGGLGYLRRSHGKMERPMHRVANTALNQYIIQATMNSALFERTFTVTNYKSYVVNVNMRGVTRYPLPKWSARLASDIRRRLDNKSLD
jgi:hypothetical protein